MWQADAPQDIIKLRQDPALQAAARLHCEQSQGMSVWSTPAHQLPAGLPSLDFGERPVPDEYKALSELCEARAPPAAEPSSGTPCTNHVG